MRKITDSLTERGKDGKNVPKLDASGKPITFEKLVFDSGELGQRSGESDEQYAKRLDELHSEVNDFYSDWGGRDKIAGIEGFANYGMDLVSRAMATPERVSTLESNRFAVLSWMLRDPVANKTYSDRWASAGKAGGKRLADKELDKMVQELKTTIPGVVIAA